MPQNKRDEAPETRSLATDVALVATPIAIAAQPLISAWADQHIGQEESHTDNPAPQRQQPQEDS